MLTRVKDNLVFLSWENYESSSHRCWPHAIRVFLEVFTRRQLSKCSHARVYQQSIKSEIQKFWSDKQDGVGGLTERYDGSRLFGGKLQCRKSIEWETFAPVPGLLNVVCQRQMVKIAKAQLMTSSVTKLLTKGLNEREEAFEACLQQTLFAPQTCGLSQTSPQQLFLTITMIIILCLKFVQRKSTSKGFQTTIVPFKLSEPLLAGN